MSCSSLRRDPPALAPVHLTWTGQQEPSPEFPAPAFFTSVQIWAEHVMKLDHQAAPSREAGEFSW